MFPVRVMVAALCLLTVGSLQAEEVGFKYNGVALRANLEKADGWPKGPVVLLTHGTLAHNKMEIMATLQALFKDNGISSLAINLSLGQNNRPSAMYDCSQPHRHRHADAVKEIGAWVEWLKFEDVKQVILLGHSRGGNQIAWYAAQQPDEVVRKVILVAPQIWSQEYAAKDYQKRYGKPLAPVLKQAKALVAAGKGDELMPQTGFIYCKDARPTAAAFVGYYQPDARFDSVYLLDKIKLPVLVFVGSEDQVVKGLKEKLDALAPKPAHLQVVVIDGADHFFRDLYAEDLVDQAVGFIQE